MYNFADTLGSLVGCLLFLVTAKRREQAKVQANVWLSSLLVNEVTYFVSYGTYKTNQSYRSETNALSLQSSKLSESLRLIHSWRNSTVDAQSRTWSSCFQFVTQWTVCHLCQHKLLYVFKCTIQWTVCVYFVRLADVVRQATLKLPSLMTRTSRELLTTLKSSARPRVMQLRRQRRKLITHFKCFFFKLMPGEIIWLSFVRLENHVCLFAVSVRASRDGMRHAWSFRPRNISSMNSVALRCRINGVQSR